MLDRLPDSDISSEMPTESGNLHFQGIQCELHLWGLSVNPDISSILLRQHLIGHIRHRVRYALFVKSDPLVPKVPGVRKVGNPWKITVGVKNV
jgi:hypothetical protein